MVFWNEIDKSLIELVPVGTRHKLRYQGGPLRFQIPRGWAQWGVSQYKSINVEVRNPDFIAWWKDLETQVCPQEPFKSNLTTSLRLKIDEATYIFDENSKQVNPDIREGLFRGQELSCLVDIESTYFFNGTWGLTCRAYQVRYWGEAADEASGDAAPPPDAESFSLPKGRCAFLESS